MKTSLARITCMAFILVFSFGCGKDSSKGGNNGATTYSLGNGYTGSGATAQAQTYFSELLTWYDSGVEGRLVGSGQGFSKGTFNSNTASNSNCSTKKFLGIPYTICTNTGSQQSNNSPVSGSQVITCTGYINGSTFGSAVGSGLTQSGCALSTTPVAYDRSLNTELVQALTAISNNTLPLLDVQKSGTTYYVFVGTANGFSNGSAAKVYVFDTAYHSIYQPLQIQDLSTGQVRGMYLHL
jgi:hypothetical protein